MPKALLDFLGYKFFFWSNENAEPPHVHVCRGKQTSNATKFWITADGIKLDHNKSQIPQNDLKRLQDISWKIEPIFWLHGLIILTVCNSLLKKFHFPSCILL